MARKKFSFACSFYKNYDIIYLSEIFKCKILKKLLLTNMSKISNQQNLWLKIKSEAQDTSNKEPGLAVFLKKTILAHKNMADGLTSLLAHKLASSFIDASVFKKIIARSLKQNPQIITQTAQDLLAVRERDPACKKLSQPFLYFKGFQALQVYRIAHQLWQEKQTATAFYLQSRSAEVFSVDIHPAAQIGSGILMDHATAVVIGETVVVEDDVSMLHEVTLGGTGKETGDRHPKIRTDVLIGAGAKILGNIEIGKGAKIGAGSVVLKPVPPHCTVAGVPAQIIGTTKEPKPSLKMDQRFC